VNDDGASGRGQARGLDGVGVEEPAGVGIVGASVAAEVGDADADDVVGGGRDAQPGFAGGESVEAGGCADGSSADGVECVPDTDGGHGFQFSGRAGFVEGLGDEVKVRLARTGKLNSRIDRSG